MLLKPGGDIDWEREAGAAGAFTRIKRLGCCKKGGLGSPLNKALATAAVMILVHRDDFDHGEIAVGRGAFRKDREVVLDSLYFCRLLETQRVLIRWCLGEFK